MTGDVFSNLDLAVKAAVTGLGVVMTDMVLIRDDLETGTRVMPFPDMTCRRHRGECYLISGADLWEESKVVTFKSWASEPASRDMAKL